MSLSSTKTMAATLLLPTFKQMLRALSSWLTKPGQDELLVRRLAPDMFPLTTQVCFVCLQTQEAFHRLQGKEGMPPSVEKLGDKGRKQEITSLDDAKAEIETTLAQLDALDLDELFPTNDSDQQNDRKKVTISLPDGLVFDMTTEEYVRDWALPQFYFHIVTAYAILRNAGVELGKADYVAHMFAHLRSPAKSALTGNK